ncbi:hypothetical protein RHMOL_Rhmol07G0039700 [Rhododendron molle]|uniref:Uncharacterized protein n=1 Tax=Rhododendron molle TaxID=49168 RepID=A0ACC0MX18_RHOML|nr:hypothetical protein RHMOL_Rhmol07G0039700 [Rhododendron molle]
MKGLKEAAQKALSEDGSSTKILSELAFRWKIIYKTEMASELIMMCQYDGKFAAIRINRGHDFSTIIHKITARWSDLDPDSVILNYSLNDTAHTILDNDDALTTMLTREWWRSGSGILASTKRDGKRDSREDDRN